MSNFDNLIGIYNSLKKEKHKLADNLYTNLFELEEKIEEKDSLIWEYYNAVEDYLEMLNNKKTYTADVHQKFLEVQDKIKEDK